jgi:hypothetical protein
MRFRLQKNDTIFNNKIIELNYQLNQEKTKNTILGQENAKNLNEMQRHNEVS